MQYRILTLLVLLAAYTLRVFRLDYQELRGDEAFGYFFIQGTYRQIISKTLSLGEPHPTLSYLVQKFWLSLAGTTEYALRFTGVLLGVVAVALLSRLVSEVRLPKRIAVVAALLLALSPYAIWHSQDARMYSMSMVLTLASTLLCVVWLRQPSLNRAIAYVVVTLFALHTHYFVAFIVVSQSLFVISQLATHRTSLRTGLRWALVQAVLWAAYAPWLLLVRNTLAEYEGNGDSPTLGGAIVRSLSVLSVGESVPITVRAVLAALALAIMVLGLAALVSKPKYRPAAWLFALYLTVPVMGAWYGSQSRPIFDERYLAAAAPPFFALAASSLLSVTRASPAGAKGGGSAHGWLSAGLIGLLLIGTGMSLVNAYTNPAYSKTRGWRELAGVLRRMSACLPAERTRMVQNYPDPTLWYYYRGPVDHLVLPPAPQDAVLSRFEVQRIVDEGVSTVFFISQPARNWDSGGIGAAALRDAFSPAAVESSAGWPVELYVKLPLNAQSMPVRFADGIVLNGHAAVPDILMPGGVLLAALQWDIADWTGDGPLKVFVQLLDGEGRLVAQEDRQLRVGEGSEQPESVVDNYGILLPDTLQPGPYMLIAGLYSESNDAERILTEDGADRVVLAYMTIPDEASDVCGLTSQGAESR